TLSMVAVNDAPLANPDTATTPEDTALTLTPAALLVNDTDLDGDTLTITSVQAPVGGTVSLVGGNVVFTPTANYNGPASFTYTVSDGNGGFSTATVNVTVTAVNDAPVDGNETNSVTEDTTLTVADGAAGDLLNNATDVDGNPLTITAFTVAGQAGPFTVGTGYAIAGVGTVTINANGSYSFAPAPNYTGAIPVITYTVADGQGGSDTSTLTLSMVAVNDAP
ncbi:cadherin-like domain-containing protein, partial [Nostoc commune]|uniref:cadherin-like domain-containing protein n=1 Tax=Nostoc commune TaxID=1178 RepID=UPI0018C7A8CA